MTPRPTPLLTLAPPDKVISPADSSEKIKAGEVWNVAHRAADLVKDGERLENLAWRHWGQPRHARRISTSSVGTASTTSLHTPSTEHPPTLHPPPRGRSFGGALKLLLENDEFKDWINDAKRNLPVISIPDIVPYIVPDIVPDTPHPNLEIRLVEPTPVPSRVGSLGASLAGSGLTVKQQEPPPTPPDKARSPRKRGKFFVHSSPSKGSGSESSHPSPTARKSSDSSSGKRSRIKNIIESDRAPRRNVSLSTMRGRYSAEKRKAAEAIAANEEDSGWEDEVEDNGDWSDEPTSPEKPKSRSTSSLNLTALLTRSTSRKTPPKPTPPPPAPTPLRKMSKKERLAAAAERARIEAELEAQTKREMFAKQQIFGKPVEGQGLLSGMFKRGTSMVDLTQIPESSSRPALRPSPTHGHLPSLGRSATPIPSPLRSKSAVAVPIESGVSVTVSPHGLSNESKQKVELETSEESEGEDDYLATSSTRRKLAQLVAQKEAKSQPVPGVRFDDQGVVQPASPTTRRRAIIMREMSESLRRNLILEREKSSGGMSRNISYGPQHSRPPPSAPTSQLPARQSAINLQQYQERHPDHRRPSANVLGGGLLRPLTQVGQTSHTSRGIGRTQSSAAISVMTCPPAPDVEAPPMVRSSTDGGRDARRRDLAKRGETMNADYRSHGW